VTRSANPQVRAGYQLRVQGHLGDHWSAWFGDLTLTHESDGTTSLSGAVPDQAELHGLLTKIRDLGVTLISVQVTDPSAEGSLVGMSRGSPAGDQPRRGPPGQDVNLHRENTTHQNRRNPCAPPHLRRPPPRPTCH
jgi:hypothetical protein